MKLKDRVAIVTGAAMGIGRAIALGLAKEGANVVVADINSEQANKVVGEIKTLGRKAIAIKVDVTKSEDAKRMAKTTLDEFGKIDILVNNAGGGPRAKSCFLRDSTDKLMRWMLSVNLEGVIYCSRAVIGHMMERRSGKIVNIASIAGMIGQPKQTEYSAAKGGVIAFTVALAREVASYGINVNCVCPGVTATQGLLTGLPERIEEFKRSTGFGRLAEPEDQANMVAFLVSDEANFISGQKFPVCGVRNVGGGLSEK